MEDKTELCGGEIKRLSGGMCPSGVCTKCGGKKMGTVVGKLENVCGNLFKVEELQNGAR